MIHHDINYINRYYKCYMVLISMTGLFVVCNENIDNNVLVGDEGKICIQRGWGERKSDGGF